MMNKAMDTEHRNVTTVDFYRQPKRMSLRRLK